MNNSSQRILALIGHEYRAAVRSRILVSMIAILVVATVISVYIASVDYRSRLADYQEYRAAAEAGGLTRIAPSPLAPLSLLRSAMEYLEIIGAIIAIALGYLSVSRERANRTLTLILSRPVSAGELAIGSVLGAIALIATLVAVTMFAAALCVGIIGNDWVNADQSVRLLITFVSGVLYMGIFYAIGATTTALSRVAANGLMIALGVWLLVVLILPQIGDTMDPDNQVPGGLFKAMTVSKPQELEILSHFTTYEEVRNDLEELSIAKHFERFSFGMIDVKDSYHGLPLQERLSRKRNDVAWLLLMFAVLVAALSSTYRRRILNPLGGNA